MADKDVQEKHDAAAKEQVAKSTADKEKTVEAVTKRQNVKPTPTQQECDLAACGASVAHKEDDGSGPDPAVLRNARALEPAGNKPDAGYQTRTAGPGPSRGTQHHGGASS
jgi:hypothetical protein